MFPTVLIAIYCVLVSIASLAGGWLPSAMRLTHVRMHMIMSFVSGLMLGVALLHMMPHAMEQLSPGWAGFAMLVGVLAMFFLLRMFHVHHREGLEEGQHDHEHEHRNDHGHQITWLGLLVGLVVHSLFDGVALAASVRHESGHGGFELLGIATFLAVLLHKPLDSLSFTSMMQAGGWSARSQLFVNCGFALVCPLGALLFWVGASQVVTGQSALVGVALAFSAGFFVCIALGDLLPEVAFHSHDRVKLSIALIVGVVLAIGIESIHTQLLHKEHSHVEDGEHAGAHHEH